MQCPILGRRPRCLTRWCCRSLELFSVLTRMFTVTPCRVSSTTTAVLNLASPQWWCWEVSTSEASWRSRWDESVGVDWLNDILALQDPVRSKDQSAFDKCYWLVYYSVQGFLKTIKEETEKALNIPSAIKYPEVEDVINKNSKGYKKKARKKSVSSYLLYIAPPAASDYVTWPHQLLPLAGHHIVDDVADRVNPRPRGRIPLEDDPMEQGIVYEPLVELVESFRPSFLLSPPVPGVLEVLEDIEDCVNPPEPGPSHPPSDAGLLVEAPTLHHLLPPLIYYLDKTELIHLIPLKFPDIDHEDFPNKPQPVCERRYHFDHRDIDSLDHFCLSSPEGLAGHCPASWPEFLSRQRSPDLPSTASLPPSHPARSEKIKCLISSDIPYYQPTVTRDLPPVRDGQTFLLCPPQSVLYSPATDCVNFPSSSLKSYTKQLTCSRPAVFVAQLAVSPHPRLPSTSPAAPQTPEFLRRNVRKAEDLFDQVRRHSRGIIFSKWQASC